MITCYHVISFLKAITNLNAISFLLSIYSHLTFNSVVALRFFYDDNSFVLDETFIEGFINNFLELYFESNFSM